MIWYTYSQLRFCVGSIWKEYDRGLSMINFNVPPYTGKEIEYIKKYDSYNNIHQQYAIESTQLYNRIHNMELATGLSYSY